MKKCTQYGELKPISDFHKRRCFNDGNNGWNFSINHNTVADYFLCIGFMNRDDLIPRHVWLLPQFVCNGKSKLSIRNTLTNLFKYKQYELDRECLNVTSSV